MQKIIKELIQRNSSKIIFIVLDGLGGLPIDGKTELEAALTPHMDELAKTSACGLHVPVSYGITPGSGPGHLSLFGYDPLEYQIGRGILEAIGLGMEVERTDVALRCNFATIENGIVIDRRAGRIPSEENRKLTQKLQSQISRIENVEVLFASGMEHRFAVIFRFPEPLESDAASVNDTDPQKEGRQPLPPVAASKAAERLAVIAKKFIKMAAEILEDEARANYTLLRGFSVMPDLILFSDAYGLSALAVANYPMYRGLARLIGMEAPEITGSVEDEIAFLKQNFDNYDFFFLHIKKVDSYGEDGNFNEKSKRIEEFDSLLPQILEHNPDVLIITGDHSTPSLLKNHSWHPVPVLLKSPYVLGNVCSAFSERECIKGELGIFRTINLMPLALANSGRLKKFGA
jgi:2,3-bisphosphoglycerate-independent phosphoglycerate mutase